MAVKVVRHTTFDEPDLRQAWAALSKTCPSAGLFTTYEWCRCWAETVGRRAQPLILEIVNDESETVGVFPLCIERAGPVRWLKFMGRDRVGGDHLDLLCSPSNADACLSAVLACLEERRRDYDGYLLGELDPASRTLARFAAWAGDRGYPLYEQEHRLVPFIGLPATFDEYLSTLKRKTRYRVRFRRRSLAGIPDAEAEIIQTPDRVEEVLADFFRLHEQRWRQERLHGLLQESDMREFLRRFCLNLAKRGGLRCYRLVIAGQAQAVLIAFHWRDTACFYQVGRRPDCPVESPGSLLIAESIEQAIREGLSRYDFLRGDEAYKFHWTSQSTEQTTLVIGCRLPARAAMMAQRGKNRAKHLIQGRLGDRAWERIRDVLRIASRPPAGRAPLPR